VKFVRRFNRAYSAISVANSIIKLAKEKEIDDLSPMKLQGLGDTTFYLWSR